MCLCVGVHESSGASVFICMSLLVVVCVCDCGKKTLREVTLLAADSLSDAG